MKKYLIQFLRIAIPLGFGIYLSWFFWNKMDDKSKESFYSVFKESNYFYVALSAIFCWLSHMSRAMRWSYMLKPLGYKTSVWNNYHAVMVGYFMNLLLPRAGEVSRAGIMQRYEKVPFETAFGSILAERVIDVIMLFIIAGTTILLQYDKLPFLMDTITKAKSEAGDVGSSNIMTYVLIGLVIMMAGGIFLYLKVEKIRNKVKQLMKGFVQGFLTIIRLEKKWPFLLHTLFIWTMYILLYVICFQCLESTSTIEIQGLMLGFLAGSVGIIFVPGGIGVYPVLITATLVPLYFHDKDTIFGLAWMVWFAQMGLIIIAGAISLYLLPKVNAQKK